MSKQIINGLKSASVWICFLLILSLIGTINFKSIAQGDLDDNTKSPLFLWKAKRNNQTVYLLGVIHWVKPDFYPLPNEVETAYLKSKEVFVECYDDDINIDKAKQLSKDRFTYNGKDKLSNHLNSETKQVFQEYLAWAGEPLEIYQNYKPCIVSQLISSDQSRRLKLVVGLDRYYTRRARESKKPLSELESSEFQINLLSGFSEKEQNAELLLTLLDLKDCAQLFNSMTEAWKKGDTDKLEELDTTNSRRKPELQAVHDKMIRLRNIGMVNKLDECLKQRGDGTYLVAVGAAHLISKNGMPTLMENKGFSIERVFTDTKQMFAQVTPNSHKLERFNYPEAGFSILMPAKPKMTASSSNASASYTYSTFAGKYTISYVSLPPSVTSSYQGLSANQRKYFSYALVQKVYDLLIADMINTSKINNPNKLSLAITDSKTKNSGIPLGNNSVFFLSSDLKLKNISQNSFSAQGYSGREAEGILIDKKEIDEPTFVRLRMISTDRCLYLIAAEGNKAWVHSPIIDEYLNSLIIKSGKI